MACQAYVRFIKEMVGMREIRRIIGESGLSRHDVKVYDEKGEECETIRDLTYSQMLAITKVLERLGVKMLVKDL